jgi:hypothetical protein
MKTCALLASIIMAVAATVCGDITLPGDWISDWNPIHIVSSGTTSTVGAIRLIHVTVSPVMPKSSDPVSVTISFQASSVYLVLDNATVDKQGSNIAIDLYWSNHQPVLIGLCQAQLCSLGYGIEQVTPTPSGVPVNKTYETTEQLGTFSPGTYQLSIHCHGAFEGEASAMFQVRDPIAVPTGTFNFGNLSQPFDSLDSIWSLIHAQ